MIYFNDVIQILEPEVIYCSLDNCNHKSPEDNRNHIVVCPVSNNAYCFEFILALCGMEEFHHANVRPEDIEFLENLHRVFRMKIGN